MEYSPTRRIVSADFWVELVWEPLKSRSAQAAQDVLELAWSRL
jgi:hypothetical protein